MTVENIIIHRVVDGKIVEERTVSDTTPVWQQRLEQERIEHARIEQELGVARRIQQASLPRDVPTLEGWQITPYYKPAREVGGDFYDFHLLPEPRSKPYRRPSENPYSGNCPESRAFCRSPDLVVRPSRIFQSVPQRIVEMLALQVIHYCLTSFSEV